MQYARIVNGAVDRIVELTAEEYAALVVNGKAAYLRIWVVDPQPQFTDTQALFAGPIVITETEARQTWVVSNKTPEEIERDQANAEVATLRQLIVSLTTDIDAYNATPDVSGTVAQQAAKLDARLKDVERQQRRTNRILRNILRRL